MMEEFVTYDIALKLKEKGFREKCLHHYNNNGILKENYSKCYCSANNIFTDNTVDAPTISQVLKWLRKEKKLYVFIDFCQHNINKELWWTYSVRDLKDDSTYILPDGCKKCRSYEGAALAGIEFVLDNLI